MTTSPLLAAVQKGVEVVDLGQSLANGIPSSPNQPGFRMSLARRHGDMVRPDGGSSANELIVTGGHVGTHVDALAHASHNGELFGGVDCMAAQSGGAFSVLGAETVAARVCRGLLLDVAALHGTTRLPPAHPVGAEELAAAAAAGGVEPGAGDVVLVNTGWSALWGEPERYVGKETGVPGITEGAAYWLATRDVAVVGADTTACEHIPAGAGHAVMPVHRVLLVEHGVHIVEHMRFDGLVDRGVAEFVIVLAPLQIVGATGAPVRPLAVLDTP